MRPDELRAACDPGSLPFRSTAELPPLEGMIGQDRAVSATGFGIGMRHAGYNLFALGPARTGKASTMRGVVTRTANEEPTPPDWCYVHNFNDPDRPMALELREEMDRLVDECKTGPGRTP